MAGDRTSKRRATIVEIVSRDDVADQRQLTALLRRRGFAVTQSSVSRDLRELGIAKNGDRYIIPHPDIPLPPKTLFAPVASFVRTILTAGPNLTVIRTATGAAQSVALAIDRADWHEVVGTISGDDTIFVATKDAQAQRQLCARLHTLFARQPDGLP